MISIGVPEKAQALINHLELESRYRTHTMLFVDDIDNTIYDALLLNRGIQRTFFNIATPYSFMKRIMKSNTNNDDNNNNKNGLQDLVNVLSKWNKAFYIPPKQSQALLQGGTFVLYGNETLYAHYDPSTAAHANIDEVMNIAITAANNSNFQ